MTNTQSRDPSAHDPSAHDPSAHDPSALGQARKGHGVILTLCAVMPAMAIVSLVPVLPFLEQEFAHIEGSNFLVPAAMTVPALCLALFSPLAGWVADKVGRKSLLVGALFVYATVGVLPYFLADLSHIIASRIVLGITEAAIITCATTLIGDYYVGERREFWIRAQVIVVSLSAILLVAVGGLMGELFGPRGPFLLYLVAAPLALVASGFLFEPLHDAGQEATDEKLPVAKLAPLVASGFLLGILFYIVIVKLGDILALKTEIFPALVGAIGAISNAGVMAGSVLFGFVKKRVSASGILSFGLALMAIGYVGLPFAVGMPLTTICIFLVSLGSGLLIPTHMVWVMQLLPMRVRGRGTGMWQGSLFLGQFVAPIVAVAIAAAAGGLETVLFIMAGLALVVAVAVGLRGGTARLDA